MQSPVYLVPIFPVVALLADIPHRGGWMDERGGKFTQAIHWRVGLRERASFYAFSFFSFLLFFSFLDFFESGHIEVTTKGERGVSFWGL